MFPPPNPDLEAKEISERIYQLTGVKVAVVISETEFSIEKLGSLDMAVGFYGIDPVDRGLRLKIFTVNLSTVE